MGLWLQLTTWLALGRILYYLRSKIAGEKGGYIHIGRTSAMGWTPQVVAELYGGFWSSPLLGIWVAWYLLKSSINVEWWWVSHSINTVHAFAIPKRCLVHSFIMHKFCSLAKWSNAVFIRHIPWINGYYLILQHNSTTPCIFQRLIHAHNTWAQQFKIR